MRLYRIRQFLIFFCLLSVLGCGGDGSSNVTDPGGGGSGGGGGGGGGGGTDPEPPEPPADPLFIVSAEARAEYLGPFQTAFQTVRDTARNDGITAFSDVPNTADNTYDGYMEIGFFSTPSASVRGEANLTLDLQTGRTSGTATGFRGSVLDSADIAQIVDFRGDINFSGGTLVLTSDGGSALSFNLDGTLHNGVQTFVIIGQLNGFLYGFEGEGLVVSGGNNQLRSDFITLVDDAAVDGTAGIWALRADPAP